MIELKNKLTKSGYLLVNKVDSSLEFATRGDILDIFSVNTNNPVRIEFFGDEIESIRMFDIVSQTSLEKLDKITILPGSDILLSEDEITTGVDKIRKILGQNKGVLSQITYDSLIFNTENDIEKILEGQLDQKIYKYYSLMSDFHYSLLDYCSDYTKIIVDENQVESSSKMLIDESWNYLNDLFEAGKNINRLDMYQDLMPKLRSIRSNIIFTKELYTKPNDISL